MPDRAAAARKGRSSTSIAAPSTPRWRNPMPLRRIARYATRNGVNTNGTTTTTRTGRGNWRSHGPNQRAAADMAMSENTSAATARTNGVIASAQRLMRGA